MSVGNGRPKPTDKLSTTQKNILKVLADGKEHYIEELHRCLSDEQTPLTNVHAHLTAIRKALDLEGKVALVTHKYGVGNTCYNLMPLAVVMPHPQSISSK
jgi:hypothetical protein